MAKPVKPVTKSASTLRSLSIRPIKPLPFPFSDPRTTYWYSGQVALWQGIQALGLQPGDHVLVPAYSCGSEVDVLHKAGLALDFYPIAPDLTVSIDQMEALCRPPIKALYVTHYFGFSQPLTELAALCQARGILLIEDNAHGLYSQDASGRWLGAVGDAAIFSLHKKAPLPDGGALYLRDEGLLEKVRRRGERPFIQHQIKSNIALSGKELAYNLPALIQQFLINRRNRRANLAKDPTEEHEFELFRANWKIPRLTKALLTRLDHKHIQIKRRHNYKKLASQLGANESVWPLFPALPAKCCPWFFPLYARKPDSLIAYLQTGGVWAGRFWQTWHPIISRHNFPFEDDLRKHLIVLPVHQDLTQRQLTRMIHLLNDWRVVKERQVGALT